MTLPVGAFNRAYLAATARSARCVRTALADPRSAQMDILRRVVASNRECDYGRRHGFASINDYSDFARRVPMADYEDVRNDVERIRHGVGGVLTQEAVEFLEPTGGSSGASKLVPYTRSLKRQMARAVHPWIRDLIVHRPELRGGRSYWAVSPLVRRSDEGPSAVPIGARHDLDYLPRAGALLIARTLALPRAVSEVNDVNAARYVTLRSLLVAEDLAFVSIWNPSFLTLLADDLDRRFDMLLHDLARGRISISIEPTVRARLERCLPARPDVATRLRRRFGSVPPTNLGELWPRLRTISCWTDGHAGRALPGMQQRFPDIEVQGKGLFATEGIVSVPLSDHPAPVAAVTSHLLEFLPESGGPPCLVDELEDGHVYEIVMTTGGGLYRYRLKDTVQVRGFAERTPMLRFLGRADATCDMRGEKLSPAFVERALSAAIDASGVRPLFALVSPRWGDPPCYNLWVELRDVDPPAEVVAAAVEAELRRAHHYDLCRSLGQLGPLQLRSITDAERAYERACAARGQRAGAVKPPALVADLTWSDLFEEVTTGAGTHGNCRR